MTIKYIGSREVAELLDVDHEYFQNRLVAESGLKKIAYRLTPKGPYKWDPEEVKAWMETKRVAA